jgi:hypothetical protein
MPKWTPQSTQQDLLTFSDNPKAKQQLRRRRYWILSVVLAVTGVIGLGAKPTYLWVRTQLINRNLEAAKVAARVEDWGTARNRARSVLIARPYDFEAYRIWFQALAHMGEPRTYLVAAGLFADSRATQEDRLDALKVLALQAPQAIAFSAYASLPKEMQEEPAALAAIAPLLIQRGATAYVEKILRNSTPLSTDPAIRLELLRSLCCHPTADRVAEARAIFAELIAANASEPALEGLQILGETPGGLAPGPPLPPLPEWVKGQPKATTLHHLLALHPAIEASPAAAETVFQQAIIRFLDVDPGTVGTWLIRFNQSARAAELLAEPAKTSPTAYIAYLHALLKEQRKAEIAATLAAPPPGYDLVDLELAKVAAARLQNDPAAETIAWNRALDGAAFDLSKNRFLELAKFADLPGAPKLVADFWVAAVRLGWGQIPMYADLKRIFASLASQGRSEDLLAMYAVLLRFEPHNPELLNNYYYLSLLHGVVRPASVVKALEDITANYPENTDFLPALAMAHLMANRPADALRLIPVMKQSKLVSPTACRALEGAALLLTDEFEAGHALFEGVNWAVFMRCESLAFRKLLNTQKFANLPLPELKELAAAPDVENLPAWRKAIEQHEKDRQRDVLPALPAPKIPGSDRPE